MKTFWESGLSVVTGRDEVSNELWTRHDTTWRLRKEGFAGAYIGGFILSEWPDDRDEREFNLCVWQLNVNPEWRRKGYGHMIMKKIDEEIAREGGAYLLARKTNSVAKTLYRKHGWVINTTRRHELEEDYDCWTRIL
jgi:ribosomal protein S18 acetylase RimI-like enzyme